MKAHCIAWAAMLAACAGFAAPVDFVTEENPPLNFTRKGEVTGTGTQVIRAALKRAGMEGKFSVMPWNDAVARARKDANACVYSTVRSADREKLFRWVGPVTQGIYSIYGLDGFPDEVKRVDELKAYRIGVVRDARLAFLRKEGMERVVETDEDADIPKMLTLDRSKADGVDLWMSHAFGAMDKARAQGVQTKVVFGSIMTQQYWLACNPAFPKASADKLDAALAAMRADGIFQKLADPQNLP